MRFVAGALVAAVLAYAAVCTLVWSRQRGLVYFGEATRVDAASTDFALARDDGAVLRGWVANPGARDVLLYFGGNAEQVHGMHEPLRAWAPGRAAYLVAYRGYGASDGEPSQDALLADALALYDEAARRHPGARIAAMGRSLGSGVAAYVAAHRPVDRLVLVTPYDSLVAVAGAHYPWLPTGWLVTERYESDRWLRGYGRPVMVIRADADRVIPPENTDRLLAVLGEPPQVITLRGAGHDDPLSTAAEGEALAGFLAAP